ncbi:cysteine synthase [Malonomonas rubra DSM 5091]|uniref:Cysteine synthase n=1 Tax=Malonomonas rubra DSM 5091 TaxID=1122189 RepID=A0A1M6GQ09_MALRU|nr:cysteine synthase A [Malonomonas rubra]SHJ12097.1 cysteine synthase [Malonomonas rubra DSM 5091]
MSKTTSSSLLDQIGNSPLVKLSAFSQPGKATVWGKLESSNPGGSIKDRIALAMVEDAESKGLLSPGMTIVEPTSGNTGIGLAMIAAIKGYKLILTMPETMSQERCRLFTSYGAELVLTPGSQGMRGAIKKATEIAQTKAAFMPQQFCNPANPAIHEKTTGPEIIAALEGKVDMFVAGVGTGGTITGVGHCLRQHNAAVKIVAVEPSNSATLSGGDAGPHAIQGIGAGFVPDILDQDVYDQVVTVSDADAIRMTRNLAVKEGLLCGISAGANVFVASELAAKMDEGQNVVTIICDTGERYLSTGIYD